VNRRRFLVTSLAAGLTGPVVTAAQPSGRVARIGFLSTGSSNASSPVHEAFRQGLREFGWLEGQNIVIEYRFAEGHERLAAFAAELVRINLEIIVALATPAIAAAKSATKKIPIVMIGAGDPVGSGFVASLARPGGNVTGLAFSSAGMGILAKQLELLMEAVPKINRVAILSNPTNPNHPRWAEELMDAGRSLRVQLRIFEVSSSDDFDGAFAAMAKERAGALLVVADSIFIRDRRRLVALAAKTRLPSFAQYRELVEAGGLMSYAPGLPGLGRGAAAYVDKILRGAAPADLPVEQPAKLELTINLKTAKALRLTIPPSLLLRADQVIE